MKPYQGHHSWNARNVALWINNDDGLYDMARDYYRSARAKGYPDDSARRHAAKQFVHDMAGCKTPDGATYNRTCVYLAMEGMLD